MIPINNTIPTYTLNLPSTGKKIEYKPFIEKERKLALMALETNNKEDILSAIKNLITTCCPNTNINQLTLFDIEYIFLHLRAKSVNEIVKLNFKCDNFVNNTICGNIIHPEIDITTVVIEGLETDLKIKFTPTFGVKMKYPTINLIENSNNEKLDHYEVIANCIEYIWDNDNIYYTKDYPLQDTIDFITKLLYNQYSKLEEFVSKIPTVKKTFNHVCSKCKYNHSITIKGYESFFI